MYSKNELRPVEKCCQQNMFTNHMYLIYMYKQDLAFNNLQWLIYHKNYKTGVRLLLQKRCFGYDTKLHPLGRLWEI